MKKIISFIRHSHPEVYKGILFFIAVVAIVYVLPKQGKFKYEFQNLKGKPWYHENLVAPFDFPIKKTKAEFAEEKAQVIKNLKPYFFINNSIISTKKEEFQKEFENLWKNRPDNKNKALKEQTFAVGQKILDSIYSKGIIEPNEEVEKKQADFSIFILKDNIAEERELKDIFTITSAHAFLKDELIRNKKGSDIKFLLPLLENSLAYTTLYDAATTNKVFKQSVDNISPSRDVILKDQSTRISSIRIRSTVGRRQKLLFYFAGAIDRSVSLFISSNRISILFSKRNICGQC